MPQPIERAIASITEDRRSDRLWSDKELSRVLNIQANKAGDWWRRTEEKLIALAADMPGETSTMLAVVLAKGLARAGAARKGKPETRNPNPRIKSE